MEELDKETGRKISDTENKQYIASVFDEDDIQYFIDKNWNIYVNNENNNKILLKDEAKISYIKSLFKPNKRDIRE